jgi:hypothetical protein
MNENEVLDKMAMELVRRKSNKVQQKLKTSKKESAKFQNDIPDLAKNINYKEDMTTLVDNILNETKKEFFIKLDKYLQEIVPHRKNPLHLVWVIMAVIFAVQLFLIFS